MYDSEKDPHDVKGKRRTKRIWSRRGKRYPKGKPTTKSGPILTKEGCYEGNRGVKRSLK